MTSRRTTLIDDQLIDRLQSADRDTQANWLFLEESQEFRGYWQVDSLWPEFFFDFEPLIGTYRLVSPATLEMFLDLADQKYYDVAFVTPPERVLEAYEYLKTTPDVTLNSTLPNNVQGFLPWQVVGYNKLIRDEDLKGAYVVWLTGGGKAFFITSAIKYHQEQGHPFDIAFVVVKSHNKLDTQRKLKTLGDIDSILIDGDLTVTRQKNNEKYIAPGPRQLAYEDIERRINDGESVVAITNYEKFREDASYFQTLVTKRNCLFFWDEMPAKLSNRETQLYRAVKKTLYSSFYSKPRPKWMRHWALTATPVENSPDDVFSCVNLLWPGLLGSVGEFNSTYVAGVNYQSGKPAVWKNLDRLEAKLQFITHRVSKEDPEVRAMFPEVIAKQTPIDWNPKHKTIYDKLTGKAKDLLDEIEDVNILALIQIMQMVCDAPSMVLSSAQNREAFTDHVNRLNSDLEGIVPYAGPKGSDVAVMLLDNLGTMSFTDVGHTKLEMWREIITEKHHSDKIITHSTWAEYIFPVWEHWLNKWGVSYVVYRGTDKQKQFALDSFRDHPDIQMFLSGDAGADSIDIAEAAVGVNYNIPWKWTTLQQRQGRRDRVNSTFDFIYTYTLTMPDSVDERKLEVCDLKFGYHEALFDGKAKDEMISAAMTRDELLYMLFG